MQIEQKTNNSIVNISLDTIKLGKQALVFLGTRQSAEKAAEEIAAHLTQTEELSTIAKEALHLPRNTKQCERLAKCIRKGTAFHHSGLTAKQRQTVEDNFRQGKIKIICCTPTLAAGVDLPAFRAIIRDVKRFSGSFGQEWIPVLEYLQMCGRAGRPKYDTEGQAILIAGSESEEDELTERYINGKPEEIFSKLAAEPVLRTYLLAIIASGLARTRKDINTFFSKTFWAHQYKDLKRMAGIIERELYQLEEWQFVKGKTEDFASASDLKNETVRATPVGARVAQLYLDPSTAREIIDGLNKSTGETFPLLHLISSALEMRPLLRVKVRELEDVQAFLLEQGGGLLTKEPSMFDENYEDFMASVKTAQFFSEWIDEKDEEFLLEKFGIRPGEIRAKLERADWLLYSAIELAKMLTIKLPELSKLRIRMQHGAREELLPLLQLRGIGRVRARALFNNRIKNLADVKAADARTLSQILKSIKVASDVKEQLGQKTSPEKEGKRKGQINLKDYT